MGIWCVFNLNIDKGNEMYDLQMADLNYPDTKFRECMGKGMSYFLHFQMLNCHVLSPYPVVCRDSHGAPACRETMVNW